MTKDELNRFYELEKRFGQRDPVERPKEIEDWYDIQAVVEALKTNNHTQKSFMRVRPEFYENREVALGLLTQVEMDDHTGAQIMAIHGADREFVLEALQQTHHKWLYAEAHSSVKNDMEIAYHAISSYPNNLKTIGHELRDDLRKIHGSSLDQESLHDVHYLDQWETLQLAVLDTLGSELGLTAHKERREYKDLHILYCAECYKSDAFHSELKNELRYATSFNEVDLGKFTPPVLVTHAEILGTFETGLRANEEQQIDVIASRKSRNLLHPEYEPLPIPAFDPLEITVGDVLGHYGMTEKSIEMDKLEPDMRKSVNSYFMHEKFMAEIGMTIKQQQEQSHTQTRRMKI